MKARPSVLRVRDWDRLYENNRSRGMINTHWFPMPNDLSADSYVELLADPNGPAHLGVWTSVLMVASRAKPRGYLAREDGRPHDSASLARVMRQPEPIVNAAIDRLLQIKLLDSSSGNSRKKNSLPRHPRAGSRQGPARTAQDGAVEGNGTEHHHQEGKGNEKESEGKRTDAEGTERESTFSPESSEKALGKNPPHRPDDENPGTVYASPEDELKAIYARKAGGPITIDLLTSIRGDLELSGVSFDDFVAAVRKHSANDWRNPPGLLRSLSKRFRAKTRPASAPVTAAEAKEQNYKCPLCFSTIRGEGLRLVGRRAVPCECASAEYIARQTDLGTFREDTPQ